MFPTIISYYTKKTPYEEHAQRLIESCKKFKLSYSIDGINSLGTWEKNCSFKPLYILQKLSSLKKPVLWIDADAEIVVKPNIFENLSSDIALHISDYLPDTHPSKMSSGTIYFNNTLESQTILIAWNKECENLLKSDPKIWDQIALRNVIFKSNAKIHKLSNAYYMVYDKWKKGDKVFVFHYQASRIEKKVINNEVVPFWLKK